MTQALSDLGLDGPVALAPMAGITDLPFRRLVARFGAGLVVSEMVASREMVQDRRAARARAASGVPGAASAIQLAGREAHWMAEAARMAEADGARLIDINFGCPAKKVTGGQSGAALMRAPDHALQLVEAVVGAVRVPVTVKMRLGWDDASLNAPEIARRAEDAGVRLVTIHGRTRCQLYRGRADWAAIARVRARVRIPVLANGDITDTAAARAAMAASGADGVMVGRGVQGAPWTLARITAGLRGGPVPDAPAGAALLDLIAAHYEDMMGFYGTDPGVRVARKHLGWYMDRAAVPEALRKPVLTATAPDAALRALRAAMGDAQVCAA